MALLRFLRPDGAPRRMAALDQMLAPLDVIWAVGSVCNLQRTPFDAALIQAEFPPLARRPIPRSLSASLKKAMKRSAKSSYQLAKEAGVSPIMLSRFLSGKRDIRLATADRLAHVLGLKLMAS